MRQLIAAVLLAGCAAPQEAPPPQSFRDPGVPVASAALFDAGRFEGAWVVVADYLPTGSCDELTVEYRLVSPGTYDVTDRCKGEAFGVSHTSRAAVTGPGRLLRSSANPFVGQVEWVLWVDEGYRTAVLADPAGTGVRILNRSRAIPPDRLAAAKEVLDFNGFETKPLREVSQ